MKHLTLIATLALSSCLLSCRTAKTTTDTTRDTTLSVTDTTTTRTDTSAVIQTETSAVHTELTTADTTLIEFVDGGGTFTIDSTGAVTLKGIKTIRGHRHTSLTADDTAASTTSATATHNERHNGLTADTSSHEHTRATVIPPPRWYESALTRLTLAVILALILYLLYRYLRRRAKS